MLKCEGSSIVRVSPFSKWIFSVVVGRIGLNVEVLLKSTCCGCGDGGGGGGGGGGVDPAGGRGGVRI
eukprot:289349-Prymnesium_polylepis.1